MQYWSQPYFIVYHEIYERPPIFFGHIGFFKCWSFFIWDAHFRTYRQHLKEPSQKRHGRTPYFEDIEIRDSILQTVLSCRWYLAGPRSRPLYVAISKDHSVEIHNFWYAGTESQQTFFHQWDSFFSSRLEDSGGRTSRLKTGFFAPTDPSLEGVTCTFNSDGI